VWWQPSCDVDSQTNTRIGALHLAAYGGHTAVIEVLVGYGANLNLTSPDESSVLHVVLGKDEMEEPDQNSPRIREVRRRPQKFAWPLIMPVHVVADAFVLL